MGNYRSEEQIVIDELRAARDELEEINGKLGVLVNKGKVVKYEVIGEPTVGKLMERVDRVLEMDEGWEIVGGARLVSHKGMDMWIQTIVKRVVK